MLTSSNMAVIGKTINLCRLFLQVTPLFSLQSTYIRNSVLHGLREAKPETAKLVSASFVYENPTIQRMATFLTKAVTDPQSTQRVDLPTRGRELQALVDRYTESFPARLALNGSARPLPPRNVYLLTGTTGGLGSNMLAQLLDSPVIMRVYAFNRPSKSATSQARHLSAFRQRGLNTNLLSTDKLVYVEGDLSAPTFALGDQLYREVSTGNPPSATNCSHTTCMNRSIDQSLTSFTMV